MSTQEPQPQSTPMMTIEQIQQSRFNIVNNLANTQTSTLILVDTLASQHEMLIEELKKLRTDLETSNTQLQVANVEIKKLKENPKK